MGKTFAMLNEGHRRFERGADVVVALVETHGRANTEAQLDGLEIVPRRTVDLRGVEVTEMDLDAVLARRPAIALVDELAHTNEPGSRHAKRWQDVDELLDAGIDVITTVNIQHLESIQDVVETITGIRQGETVPDRVVRDADQLELVRRCFEAGQSRLGCGAWRLAMVMAFTGHDQSRHGAQAKGCGPGTDGLNVCHVGVYLCDGDVFMAWAVRPRLATRPTRRRTRQCVLG